MAVDMGMDRLTAHGPTRSSCWRAVVRAGTRTSGPQSLTAAQQQVARLAADGRTNRQIAEELFVTIKTVETHLAAVYRKLDIATRDALADLLAAAEGTSARAARPRRSLDERSRRWADMEGGTTSRCVGARGQDAETSQWRGEGHAANEKPGGVSALRTRPGRGGRRRRDDTVTFLQRSPSCSLTMTSTSMSSEYLTYDEEEAEDAARESTGTTKSRAIAGTRPPARTRTRCSRCTSATTSSSAAIAVRSVRRTDAAGCYVGMRDAAVVRSRHLAKPLERAWSDGLASSYTGKEVVQS